MRKLLFAAIVCAALGIAAFGAQTPSAPQQQQPPAPSADPYLNNAAAGATQFPLAAPAGKDSNARAVAPAGGGHHRPLASPTREEGAAVKPPAGPHGRETPHRKHARGGAGAGGAP